MSETVLNGRYRLETQQGSGGMAVIYGAVDQELGRKVAVKILRPSLTNDPEFLKRFKDEARNVANLSHPNIVTVYDVGSDGTTHYMVMEFVDGSDLKKLIRKEGALPVPLAVDLSVGIASGIGFAHRSKLVHADVKPQNVLLTSSQQVKVTDFGIAQALHDATTSSERQQVVWGSPHYFAPEQARGEKPSPASDVYSIGIVMFELLTGQLPYVGASQQDLAMAHIRNEIPHVRDYAPHVPAELDRIVYKLMSKEPTSRYRVGDQLAQVLVAYRQRGQQNTSVNPRVYQSAAPEAPSPSPQPNIPAPEVPAPPADAAQPQQRPLYREPEPTQKYSVAPEAPPPPPNYRPPVSAPVRPSSAEAAGYVPPVGHDGGLPPQPSQPLQRTMGSTGRSVPIEPAESGLDVVTIVLAFLAFVAVAGLLPLYYLVYLVYRN